MFFRVGYDELYLGVCVVVGEEVLDVGEGIGLVEGADDATDDFLMLGTDDFIDFQLSRLDKVGEMVLDGAFGDGTLFGDVGDAFPFAEHLVGDFFGVDFLLLGLLLFLFGGLL